MSSNRTFDLIITKLKDDSQVTFASIEKEEQKNLINYFKTKQVKVRILDVESNEHVNLKDDSSEEEEESKEKGKRSKGGDDDDYDSEEDDEDFVDEDSPEESDSEEDEEMDDDMEVD
mmetsp:Transcript_25537/g.19312  ORF Transcript_25537/g.19312 Transcript_25537/m.19312 type:complete len:117 (-) Transcript_25537:155-505(-)